MAEDPFKGGHGWLVLFDDGGDLIRQLEQPIL